MRSVTMNASYDKTPEDEYRHLFTINSRWAQKVANETGETVEIYTTDDVLVGSASPEEPGYYDDPFPGNVTEY